MIHHLEHEIAECFRLECSFKQEGRGGEGRGEGKGREGKGREGKGREGKGREGKGREGKDKRRLVPVVDISITGI